MTRPFGSTPPREPSAVDVITDLLAIVERHYDPEHAPPDVFDVICDAQMWLIEQGES